VGVFYEGKKKENWGIGEEILRPAIDPLKLFKPYRPAAEV